MSAVGEHGVVQLPELPLAMRGYGGSGGQCGLRVYIERVLLEDKLHLAGVGFEHGSQADDGLGAVGALEV